MVHTIATITGDGSPHQLSAQSVKASWVQLQAGSSNSANARVGDLYTTSNQGAVIPGGGAQFFPTHGNANIYNLNQIYYYLANGDTMDVTYCTV